MSTEARRFGLTKPAVTFIATVLACTEPEPVAGITFIGAGDIGECGGGSAVTAAIIDTIPGTVYTLGDNAYSVGSAQNFAECYDPTWGRFKNRTRPSPGNHDYGQPGAAGYFDYFGTNAGDTRDGWYSYTLGEWHVISLNSEAAMGPASGQLAWLINDLANNPAKCTIAYWHRPRFTSGPHGNEVSTAPLMEALYAANAEIVMSGHDHLYERFAPQTPGAKADFSRGIRQFVVGTGGAAFYQFETPQPQSEVRLEGLFGVLRLQLAPDSYRWQFIASVNGVAEVRDEGETACH
jgi:acid phosphatase type 7